MSFIDGDLLRDAVVAGSGLTQMHDYYVDNALRAGQLEPLLEKIQAAGRSYLAGLSADPPSVS